ncbi:TM0106 family RecB-like putative nuclease [Pseudomonas luteola]|uniref:TM0106 family RecB-like putative nuclease n=1 Tax=Pseudomonas luteola TaxID=47886 RepID=UPI00123B9E99|nr:TM0106 family RecB-like putative nuclease [Pseudomonas luteola]QEU26276.1 TM0106 family RecB-like putative nuclease [Pseudomonas luteola]
MQVLNGTRLYSASDICFFLECQHLTATDLISLETPLARTLDSDEIRLIQERGLSHEAAFLARLRQQYTSVIDVPALGAKTLADKVRLTHTAMQRGADIVFQGTLQDGVYIGHADFLKKVPQPSVLGDYSYEVIDTKLARLPKGKFIVQLAFYSRLLARAQGYTPRLMHLVLGSASLEETSFLVREYADYLDSILGRFERFVSAGKPPVTYPEPCDHCPLCHWSTRCREQRDQDDHLSSVASISRSQIRKLRLAGIRTTEQLGEIPEYSRVPGISAESLARLRQQARLQVQERITGIPVYELLAQEAGRGLGRLPRPAEGDLFFDMEGNPLEPGGLEYLFGLYIDQAGNQYFKSFWAHSRHEEKQAFEAFIDFVTQHLEQYPRAHVYHYASYEESALKRLMAQHGTREAQVDWLLRNGKLVDLYKVVREAVRVSASSYSIKAIERFYMPPRDGEVTTAGASIVFYENWKLSQDADLLEKIERYNEDDVRSTYKLRNWLLGLGQPGTTDFQQATPQEEKTLSSQISQEMTEHERRLESYRQRLLRALPYDESLLDAAALQKVLIYQLLDFYRRMDKPVWWDMFRRQDMTSDELIDDAESLAGLEYVDTLPAPLGNNHLYRYRFPEQETKLRAGSTGIIVETLKSIRLHELDSNNRLATFRCPKANPPPEVFDIGPGAPINSKTLQQALFRYADAVLEGQSAFRALADFLGRRHPRVKGIQAGQPLLDKNLPFMAAIKGVVHNLDESTLFIQGPPGAGKTFTGSHLILDLLMAGKRIGIASNSHHAIHNLLAAVESRVQEARFSFTGLKKSTGGNDETRFESQHVSSMDNAAVLIKRWLELKTGLVAGTVWLFADPQMTQTLDYLFIDEAGQVSLANFIAMGMSARNIVLMGDQMQLSQPVRGVHPGRSGDSTLDYLLNGSATIPAEQGIFLAQSWRMHPDVCRFISEVVYEGRLTSAPGTENQQILPCANHPEIPATGLYFHAVRHDGNSQSSTEEAQAVQELYHHFLGRSFQDRQGKSWQIGAENILVVAPYNLQVELLKRLLPLNARVGTVDRFQGQEAEIVIVSMATSNEDCLPRDIDFLYSRNRLNVAISRARSLTCIVASPDLAAIRCKTPQEMELVNTFCRLMKAGKAVAQV